jgi:hypothetical protein
VPKRRSGRDRTPDRRVERAAGRDDPRIELRGAAIAGLAVVFAAVVTGVAATLGPWLLQRQDDRRENRVERRQATGAARLLTAEFLQAATQMGVLANDRLLRRFDRTFAVQIEPSDLRLIAVHIGSAERWGQVQNALAAVQGLETFVNTLLERGRTKLTSGEVCLVRFDFWAVRLAADELAPLARFGVPEPPDLPTCTPDPGVVLMYGTGPRPR